MENVWCVVLPHGWMGCVLWQRQATAKRAAATCLGNSNYAHTLARGGGLLVPSNDGNGRKNKTVSQSGGGGFCPFFFCIHTYALSCICA